MELSRRHLLRTGIAAAALVGIALPGEASAAVVGNEVPTLGPREADGFAALGLAVVDEAFRDALYQNARRALRAAGLRPTKEQLAAIAQTPREALEEVAAAVTSLKERGYDWITSW